MEERLAAQLSGHFVLLRSSCSIRSRTEADHSRAREEGESEVGREAWLFSSEWRPLESFRHGACTRACRGRIAQSCIPGARKRCVVKLANGHIHVKGRQRTPTNHSLRTSWHCPDRLLSFRNAHFRHVEHMGEKRRRKDLQPPAGTPRSASQTVSHAAA